MVSRRLSRFASKITKGVDTAANICRVTGIAGEGAVGIVNTSNAISTVYREYKENGNVSLAGVGNALLDVVATTGGIKSAKGRLTNKMSKAGGRLADAGEEALEKAGRRTEDWHTYYVSEEEVLVHNRCMVTGSGNSSSGY